MGKPFTYNDAIELLTSQGATEQEARSVLKLFMLHVAAGKTINARPICEDCFTATKPHRRPVAIPAENRTEETCYLCGKGTEDGIYT